MADQQLPDGKDYSCPSAPADSEGAKLLGIVLGTADRPEVSYISRDMDIPVAEVLKEIDPAVSPTRVLRFSAKCQNTGCGQFDGQSCRLGRDIAKMMAPADDLPPPCNIRKTCRWYAENGPSVCLRCSRVVTTVLSGDDLLMPIVDLGTVSVAAGTPAA